MREREGQRARKRERERLGGEIGRGEREVEEREGGWVERRKVHPYVNEKCSFKIVHHSSCM